MRRTQKITREAQSSKMIRSSLQCQRFLTSGALAESVANEICRWLSMYRFSFMLFFASLFDGMVNENMG